MVSVSILYGCCQIELSVRDLQATRAFMQSALGAGAIEQQLAREIGELFPDGGYRVDHLDCGEALFQLNEPSPSILYNGQKSIHQAYLDRIGNCVTNLNFFVDDAAHAHDLLTRLGAQTHLQGPSCAAPSLADYGPDNTRPGADGRKFYFIGSRDLIGLDLEIMEPNFLRFSRQTVQYPCFMQPRPATGDGTLRLLRLRLVVADLEETYRNLAKIFAPASRSNAYGARIGPLAKAFRIGLGGIELEYCQPLSREGYLAEQLHTFGPGVAAIEFGARDLERALGRVREAGAPRSMREGDILGLAGQSGRSAVRVQCRHLTGFDLVLGHREDDVFS
ncbi:MAG TPA: hypothetical protein VME42_12155 [Steroidobacteraceae bacterium]|nr:hypothetical protein [Steroidobacteraceae bacterium]